MSIPCCHSKMTVNAFDMRDSVFESVDEREVQVTYFNAFISKYIIAIMFFAMTLTRTLLRGKHPRTLVSLVDRQRGGRLPFVFRIVLLH